MMMVKFSTSTSETSMILFSHTYYTMDYLSFLNILSDRSLEQDNILALYFHNFHIFLIIESAMNYVIVLIWDDV